MPTTGASSQIVYSATAYMVEDYPHTLFPLSTTRVVVEHSNKEVSDYIYQAVLNPARKEHSFLPQVRCYAPKHGLHLRRTVKLDPVAEYFVYDWVYRNRQLFRKDHRPNRVSFGYRFEAGRPVSPNKSYGEFKKALADARRKYRYSLGFDVASYFNSIYHHDIVAFFSQSGASAAEVEPLGQFLREANTGRSVDCLPQGLNPCKAIGSEFLKFVDNSIKVRCELMIRFMDDFFLFSDDEDTLDGDFLTIQAMLGEKGLSLNASKTRNNKSPRLNIAEQIDRIKADLLQIRRRVIDVSGFEIETDEVEELYSNLTPEQLDYLFSMLKSAEIDESDAELILVLLRESGEQVLEKMGSFLRRFPSLIKNIYNFAKHSHSNELAGLSNLISAFVRESQTATEYQLFWLGKLAEDFLKAEPKYGDILHELISHSNASDISKAKILEIADNRYGLSELRHEHLRTGKSDWLSWSAAVETRNETSIHRNHVLSYFVKGSPMNKIIGDCIKSLP